MIEAVQESVTAIEDWLDSGELDLNATRADYDFAREHDTIDIARDARIAELEAQVGRLRAALAAAYAGLDAALKETP